MRHIIRTSKISLVACLGVCLLPMVAQAKGTHFLVEPYTGVVFNQGLSMENAVGLESGALLGVGGKFKGFPPRFYLYFKASQSYFGEDDVFIPSRDANACVRRSYTRVTGGLRTVIPLFWYVRLNLDIGAGSLFSQNKLTEAGFNIDYPEDLTVMELGAGLNLRLYRWLSVGLMYNHTFVVEEEHGDMIANILGEAQGGSQLGWHNLTATLGFHF